VAVARGFELRIATSVSDMGVDSSNISSSSISVGRLRVHAGVEERHLLQHERKGIMGRNDIALSRAEVRGIRRRNMWRVGRANVGAIAAKERRN
jgi:hypothetical protein